MAAALPYAPSRAPWREILDYHLRQTPGYEFTIATIGINQQGRAVPRVRVCGFRGFFPVLQLHPDGELDMKKQVANGGNPPTFESDMLTFTTDARMEKIEHLQSSGQEIEALFWLKEVSSQWRIKGKAFSIGNPCGEKDQQELESRAAIRKALRTKSHDGCEKEGWSWEHAVTRYFANHAPAMRGIEPNSLKTEFETSSRID